MTIAFVFFMPVGALVSRYYRIVFVRSWFKVSELCTSHVGNLLFVFSLFSIGHNKIIIPCGIP